MERKTGTTAAGAEPPAATDDTVPRDLGEARLDGLGPRLHEALRLRREGKDPQAEHILRELLRVEPRLAEPRLELAHLAASRGDWDEAVAQAREAVSTLRAGGQWTEDMEPAALLAFALNLLGEVLVRSIEDTDLYIEEPERFTRTWNEAALLFDEARRLDPRNPDAAGNCGRYRPLPLPPPSA
jgi:tetratricopeptide (TPR) repeat protein